MSAGSTLVAGSTQQQQTQSVVALRQRAEVAYRGGTFKGLQPSFGHSFLQSALLHDVQFALLVDGGIQEKTQQHGRGAVDGHRNGRGGVAQVEARIQNFGVVQLAHVHARVTHFPVDIGAEFGIFSVERHRIEGRRKAFGGHPLRHVVEAAVGTRGAAFAGKHAGRIFAVAFEGKHPGRKRKLARYILGELPAQYIAPIGIPRQGYPGYFQARKRFCE